jgi:hypothetical protein
VGQPRSWVDGEATPEREPVELTKPRWRNALPPPRTAAEYVEHTGLTAASWLGSKLGLGDGICCWARAV